MGDAPVTFNALITSEDLTTGQSVTSYAVDYFDTTSRAWKTFPTCGKGQKCVPGLSPAKNPTTKPIPPTAEGICGAELPGVNLVSGAPPTTHVAGITPTADACKALCAKDKSCKFWTWHDEQVTPPSFKGKCYVRHDSDFTYKHE